MASTAKSTDPTLGDIWQTLSALNVNDFVKTLGDDLTYLSWAKAWEVLMEHYPQATYQFDANEVHLDGTITVHCSITIGEHTRTMWLPVMKGYSHRAVANPDARLISDNKMRCLTKCMAMFGLGHYIYDGEDLPKPERQEEEQEVEQETERKTIYEMGGTEEEAQQYVTWYLYTLQMQDDANGVRGQWKDNIGPLRAIEKDHPKVHAILVQKNKEYIAGLDGNKSQNKEK